MNALASEHKLHLMAILDRSVKSKEVVANTTTSKGTTTKGSHIYATTSGAKGTTPGSTPGRVALLAQLSSASGLPKL